MAAKRNSKIKRANQETEFTPHQLLELKKCSEDPIYFAINYVKIQHPTRGAIKFKLYDYQIEMMKAFQKNRYNAILSARQTGKSITSAIYLLWFAIFQFDKKILIASNKNKGAMDMIKRIRYAYENLPMWLKPGITDDGWNKHTVSFDNDSTIDSTATSEDSGRGESLSLLFLDEFAFVKPNIQEEFWTSILPTLSTGGSCIMSSTPNGDSDLFATLWRSALVGKDMGEDGQSVAFVPMHIDWQAPPGRDEKFKRIQIGLIGEQKWKQEYECEFISSDALLISSMVLAAMTPRIDKTEPIFTIKEVKFYKQLKKNGTYLVSVDPSTGTGKDFSVIQVFEFPSLIQVAEYRSNTMSSVFLYMQLKNIIKFIEKEKATVYFSIENNGVGEGLIALYDADEDPPEDAEFISESGKNRYGMTTTKKAKMRACLTLKEMMENDNVTINSKLLLAELKSFTRRRNSYRAQAGSTDDAVSALLIIMRLIEEMSTYEEEAYDKLYSMNNSEDDWWNDSPDGSDPDDDNDGDNDALPMIF